MQKHRDLTRQRLAQFASDKGLRGLLYPQTAPVQLSVFHAPGRITWDEAMKGDLCPAAARRAVRPGLVDPLGAGLKSPSHQSGPATKSISCGIPVPRPASGRKASPGRA